MGDSTTYFSQNYYAWLRKVYIILQDGPIAITWVPFYKYIAFNSKPFP